MLQWIEECLLPEGLTTVQGRGPIKGRTYVMYHGTSKESAESICRFGFKRSKDGMLGPGVYLSRDLKKASRYPLHVPEQDRVVIKVKVNVGKVKAIDCQGHSLQKSWHDRGYDTAWVPPNCGMVKSGLEEDCVWDPKRITVIDVIRPRSQSQLQPQANPSSQSQSDSGFPMAVVVVAAFVILLAIILVKK